MSMFGPGRGRRGKSAPESDLPRSKDLGQIRHLYHYLAPYRGVMIGALIALCVSAAAVLALGQGLRILIDDGLSSEEIGRLHEALIYMVGMVALLTAGTFARFYLVSWLGERVVADIRQAIFGRLVRMSPAFFETNKTGELLSRVTTDTSLLQTVIGSQASSALRNLLLFLGGSVMLLVTSPKLTGFVVLLVPVVIVPIIILGRRVRRYSRLSQDRIGEIGGHLEETLNGIHTVQAFGHEGLSGHRFGEHVETAFGTALIRVKARALLTAIVIMLVFCGIGLVLWIAGYDVLDGAMTGGEMTAFMFYAVVVAGAVGSLSEVYGDLQHAAGAAERLAELLSHEPAVMEAPSPTPLPEPRRGAVALDHVTFHYPSRPDEAALSDFTLAVEPGETVALVGPSGAGKSTVFNLLLRFYDPTSGRVTIDGIAIQEAALADVRTSFGLVPQDPIIFAASARENIRFGRPDADDAAIHSAADAAGASAFLDALPDGYDSFLGEKGTRLSGGQKQRLALARAVLRNPPILLLDEATSALDAESERAVQEALERLMRGRTTIVIAHRLATVQKADRIIVMDEGRVVAEGTHQSLLAEGGLYARLAALQFGFEQSDSPTDQIEVVAATEAADPRAASAASS
jgi:ATP-binding cassette subfamily B protein